MGPCAPMTPTLATAMTDNRKLTCFLGLWFGSHSWKEKGPAFEAIMGRRNGVNPRHLTHAHHVKSCSGYFPEPTQSNGNSNG